MAESVPELVAELEGSHLETLAEPAKELVAELEGSLPVEEPKKRLIIGIDFGTTYSGVAYCFPDKRTSKPRTVVNWPGAVPSSTPKIPTLISYDKQDPTAFTWGALVDKKSDSVVGVKLLLDPCQEYPSYLPTRNLAKDIKSLAKPPQDIAADFLGALNQHALAQIEQAAPAGAMEGREKEYVLSGKSRDAQTRGGGAAKRFAHARQQCRPSGLM